MMSWNVIANRDGTFTLLNGYDTIIRLNRILCVDVAAIMSKMEEANVPISYTKDIKEIYFTVFHSRICGDYFDNQIRISYGRIDRLHVNTTLVHELAHHIDDAELLSENDAIKNEYCMMKRWFPADMIVYSPSEYVACGFEMYYFGSKEQISLLKKNNPKLLNFIRKIDKKYRK